MADDFTSAANWNLDSMKFFGYQTGAVASSITGVYVQIWDGNPSAGGTVVWGDLTTNRLQRTGFSNIYRALSTTPTNCDRRIQEVVATTSGSLPAGQYWVQWGLTGSLASGPWCPPVTISGVAVTGDALQLTPTGWTAALNGTTSPNGAPFIVYGESGAACPVGPASNPSPASGTMNVDINPGNATWTNGAGTTNVEVFFGPQGSAVSVYSGTPITSLAIPGPLAYATTYEWRVVCSNDTCSGSPVENWTFTTIDDPLLAVDTITVFPQSLDYWTGTTDGATKTQVSLVDGNNTLDGWMKFDISGMPAGATVTGVTFNAFVNATNWPWWSVTPMALDPVTATAADVYAAIQAGEGLGTAYLYSNEANGYTTGPKTYPLAEGNILPDLTAAVANGYFAVGISSRDNSATYFITFDGWNEANPPSLDIVYEYIVPVELTSFAATTDNKNVNLNWSTATELNNSGFQIERSSGSDYQVVGFVAGHGTTTETQNYSLTVIKNVNAGSYTYRLKQIDFDGTFEYSNAVEVEVLGVKEFALGQNYPNPFNPSTTINFSLAVDSKVSLKIFDVLGQEVATLLNGQLAAGSQKVSFNASSLNSGVYFYRIDASGIDGQKFSSVKKMMLTK